MKFDLSKILEGTKHRIKTVFPFSDMEIYLRVLNEKDLQEACSFTDSKYKDSKIGFDNIDERNSLKAMRELFHAIVDENGNRLFLDWDTFCEAFTPEAAKRLIQEQNTFQEECSPDISNCSEAQLITIIEELKKKSETILHISDSRLLKKLLLFTVSQLSKQPTSK